jgi:hypothetical protein
MIVGRGNIEKLNRNKERREIRFFFGKLEKVNALAFWGEK